MKSCEQCATSESFSHRVEIGEDYKNKSIFYKTICVLLIYLPLFSLPFVVLSAVASYLHLKMAGARNIRSYRSFLPDPSSHRYNLKTQITMEPGFSLSPISSRLFWISNCIWYCPHSVALFEWHAYLVKLVENWWCPFHHDKKNTHYKDGAINRSFWHLYPEDMVKLHPEDRDNPIWNKHPEK